VPARFPGFGPSIGFLAFLMRTFLWMAGLVLFGLGVFAQTPFREEPLWIFNRQLLSEEGKPIPDVRIHVECFHDQTSSQRLLDQINRAQFDLLSDRDGYFHVATNANSLYLTINKAGFIQKRFECSVADATPSEMKTNSGTILLHQRVPLPKADDLDILRGQSGDLVLESASGWSNEFIFMADSAGRALVVGKMKGHLEGTKLAISFPSSEGVSEIDCTEPGLTIDSWEENNAIAPNVLGQAEQYSLDASEVMTVPIFQKEWAFFVKYPEGYVRLRIKEAAHLPDTDIWPFYITYSLSRDRYFVRKAGQ
jgi:hypothetical protein